MEPFYFKTIFQGRKVLLLIKISIKLVNCLIVSTQNSFPFLYCIYFFAFHYFSAQILRFLNLNMNIKEIRLKKKTI